MSFIEIDDVRKRFGGLEVLKGATLAIERGEVVCLLGPSGSGKTTLLRCVNHLERIDGGAIRIDGHLVGYQTLPDGTLREQSPNRIAQARLGVGMVFQRFNLFPHLTVLDNLLLAPVRVAKKPRPEAEREAHALLEQVGLADKANCYPRQLSGGQQQRVAIARALAMAPAAMLFDEPTSALDPELVGVVLEVMRQLAASGMTMIVVTHELAFARGAADRVVMMDAGMIVEDAPSHEFFARPQHPRSQAFLRNLYQRDQLPTTDSVNATTEFAGTGKGETR